MAMDYDEWLKAGNGARKDESLEDAVGRTVQSMYEWVCPKCYTTNTVASSRCSNCGHELR
jgi:ribosomal protein L40E